MVTTGSFKNTDYHEAAVWICRDALIPPVCCQDQTPTWLVVLFKCHWLKIKVSPLIKGEANIFSPPLGPSPRPVIILVMVLVSFSHGDDWNSVCVDQSNKYTLKSLFSETVNDCKVNSLVSYLHLGGATCEQLRAWPDWCFVSGTDILVLLGALHWVCLCFLVKIPGRVLTRVLVYWRHFVWTQTKTSSPKPINASNKRSILKPQLHVRNFASETMLYCFNCTLKRKCCSTAIINMETSMRTLECV